MKVPRKPPKIPESDRVETTRPPPGPFSEMFRWHLDHGTHPAPVSVSGGKWKAESFAAATRNEAGGGGISAQMVRAYCRGASVPSDFRTVARPLFGDDDTKRDDAKEELRQAWLQADANSKAKSAARRRQTIPPKLPNPPRRPEKPERCFGRDEDISELVAELTGSGRPAVVLLGTGGIGKTTLAAMVAHDSRVEDSFGNRIWLVDATKAKTAGEVEAEVARALGFDPAQARFSYILERLRARGPALLLLDNLETPWNEDRRGTREILKQLSNVNGLVLLATLRGNTPPDTPEWTCKWLRRLSRNDARKMFLSYARQVANDSLLNAFLDELHGLPLLIKLVALRAANRNNLQELWEQWLKLGVRAAHDPDAADERHGSLTHSVAFSWQSSRLSLPARRLFRLLGQLPAGISKDDRRALLGDDALEAAEQFFALGLAEWRAGDRLDLLPPIRDVARYEYRPVELDDPSWWRYYLDLVMEQGVLLRRAQAKQVSMRLGAELANIEAAVSAAVAGGEARRVGPAADGIGRILRYSGLGDVGSLREAAEACRKDPEASGSAAECFIAVGEVESLRSAPWRARIDFVNAMALARSATNEPAMAAASFAAAELDRLQGKRDNARAGYKAARALYEAVGDDLSKATSFCGLAYLDSLQGKGDNARAGYKAALGLYEALGNDLGKATCLCDLAELDRLQGKGDDARAGYEAALGLYEALGDDFGKANCFRGLAGIAEADGRVRDACQLYLRARNLYRLAGQTDWERWIAWKQRKLGCSNDG